MALTDFLLRRSDVARFGDVLVELYLKNPSGVETVVRLSRRGTITPNSTITLGSDTIAANTPFQRRLLYWPSITQSLWAPGQILSNSTPSFGSLEITNEDGGLTDYSPATGWQWAGMRYKEYFCDSRSSRTSSTIGKIGEGILGDPDFSLSRITVPLNGLESLFSVPLSQRVHRGTGGMLELSGVRVVNYGSPAALNITGDITIGGWMWHDTHGGTDLNFYGWMLGGFAPWVLRTTSTRAIQFRCHVGGVAEFVTSTMVLSTQNFYHVTVVVSGRNVIFYIYDDAAQTTTVETFVNGLSATPRSLNVGGSLVQQTSGTHVLWLDEWRVHNTALTRAQIEADRFRELESGSLPATLKHWLKYNDATGTTVLDGSTSAANGTISGAGTSTWLHSQEGGSELAGSPKPDVYGENFGVDPVLVDPVRQGYSVAGGGSVQQIISQEGGLNHTMVTAASFRAYLTTTPAAGTSLRYPARGLFKLGSVPVLPISAYVEGYNGGSLGYVNKSATITRDVVTRRGPKLSDPSQLDTTAFTAHLAANPAIMGVFYKTPDSKLEVRNVLDFANVSAGSWWGTLRGSTLFYLADYSAPTVTPDYAFKKHQIVSIDPLEIDAVIWRVVVRYRKNHTVLSEDQVAASIKGTSNWQQWTEEWQSKEAPDWVVRDQFPGESSITLTIDTGLQYGTDAQTLADSLLAILKGQKQGYAVTVDAVGLQVLAGKTATFEVELQKGRTLFNLDGTQGFLILSTSDNVRGRVSLQVIG
jgi:hypothetical protein